MSSFNLGLFCNLCCRFCSYLYYSVHNHPLMVPNETKSQNWFWKIICVRFWKVFTNLKITSYSESLRVNSEDAWLCTAAANIFFAACGGVVVIVTIVVIAHSCCGSYLSCCCHWFCQVIPIKSNPENHKSNVWNIYVNGVKLCFSFVVFLWVWCHSRHVHSRFCCVCFVVFTGVVMAFHWCCCNHLMLLSFM